MKAFEGSMEFDNKAKEYGWCGYGFDFIKE